MNLPLRTDRPLEHRIAFIDALIFIFIGGGTDAHAKNYSLPHEPQLCMAPLYNVASGPVHSDRRHGNAVLAMRIGRRESFDAVMPRHWDAFATQAKIGSEVVWQRVTALAAHTTNVVDAFLAEYRKASLTAPLTNELANLIKWCRKAVG